MAINKEKLNNQQKVLLEKSRKGPGHLDSDKERGQKATVQQERLLRNKIAKYHKGGRP